MNFKRRNLIQLIITLTVISSCTIYYLYINDYINFRLLSIGDMNPYGGWSAFKSAFTDLSYRWRGFSRSIALSIAVMLISLFLGRFFCGFICPIGALQDFFKYIGVKIGLKAIKLKKPIYSKLELLKYFILIAVLVLSILEMGNLIGPFSPWLAYLNCFLGLNFTIGTIILLAIIVVSLFAKRIFCRFFCPLGAFQSLLYAIGPFKIHKSQNCNGCAHCIRNCPVNIENNDDIISPECINCLECIDSSCINGNEGYSMKFAGRKINSSKYIIICLVLFVGIYFILPVVRFSSDLQLIGNIGNIQDGLYSGDGIGFGGNIEVEVKINKNEIREIKIINHRETSGYYQEVFKELAKEIIETQGLNVDAVSGATASSRGFINAVKDAVSQSLSTN
ncbi:MAG: 4Fe-4S binding protein [Sedimentibacter sp.]